MKVFALFLLAFVTIPLSAQTSTVREQLEELNINWKSVNPNYDVLSERIPLSTDVELIQMHLTLVEHYLRTNPPASLNTEQLAKREACLDLLNTYCNQGLFPKNTGHEKRTPYFIDYQGTACAVGQLIIETGHKHFAERVSKENNFAYIRELNYPELDQWAMQYGFTIDELAWIQPGYALCDTNCVYSASIFATGGQAPYSYYWSNGDNSSVATGLCPGQSYTCLVIDAQGDTISPLFCATIFQGIQNSGTNEITIPPSSPTNQLSFDLSSTDDSGGCSGTATCTVTSGHTIQGYMWSPSGQNTATATGLCAGWHQVTVFTDMFCERTDSILIGSLSLFENETQKPFILNPNPFETFSTISDEHFKAGQLTIFNALGQVVFHGKIENGQIYRNDLENGVYLFTIVNDQRDQISGKFILK